MTDQNQTEATVVPARVVELVTGEKANFGARNNLLSGFDTETGVITFKVFTGEVIDFDVNQIENLGFAEASELAKTAILYAYLNKVKANLAPVKLQEKEVTKVTAEDGTVSEVETGVILNTLAAAVVKEVAKLQSGEFPIRGLGGEEGIELTVDQKAFAAAVVNHPPFAGAVKVTAEQCAGWGDIESEDTINAVSGLWDSYDTKVKNKIRKNGFFLLEKGLLTKEDEIDSLV